MSAPVIRVGQIWQRHRDGVRVEITRYDSKWDDCTYRTLPHKRKASAIFGFNLRSKYSLVSDSESDPRVDAES